MAKNWSKWESALRTKLESPDLLKELNDRAEANGHQDSKGRITYNRIANGRSFGIFSEMVHTSFPRDGIYTLPSIARTLKRDAIVYPWYLVLFTSLESGDFELSRSETSGRTGLAEMLDYYDTRTAGAAPMIGLAILEMKSMGMFHGIAFVVWKNAGAPGYTLAYYDPIAYQRKHTRADGATVYVNYDYAVKTFQPKNFPGEDVEFVNLSDFCLKKDETQYHCPQYTMNAEYCFMNSLYFLFKWAALGRPTEPQGLRRVVEACYIVAPAALTRANTHESMTYRVIMLSFIVTAFYRYFVALGPTHAAKLAAKDHLEQVLGISRRWHDDYGFHLLHPMFARTLNSRRSRTSAASP